MKKKKTEQSAIYSEANGVPVMNPETISQYNTTPLRGFSIFNDEGDYLFKEQVEQVASELRGELYPAPVLPEEEKEEEYLPPVKIKGYVKKHVFSFILILICNIAVLVSVVGGFCQNAFSEYFAPFIKDASGEIMAVSHFDGVLALLNHWGLVAPSTISSVLVYDHCADAGLWAEVIIMSIMFIVCVLMTIHNISASIVALASGKKDGGTYAKVKFGWSAIVTFVFGLVGAFLLAGTQGQLGFGDVCALLAPRQIFDLGVVREAFGYTVYAGYGIYALLLTSIVTFICSCCGYKKVK